MDLLLIPTPRCVLQDAPGRRGLGPNVFLHHGHHLFVCDASPPKSFQFCHGPSGKIVQGAFECEEPGQEFVPYVSNVPRCFVSMATSRSDDMTWPTANASPAKSAISWRRPIRARDEDNRKTRGGDNTCNPYKIMLHWISKKPRFHISNSYCAYQSLPRLVDRRIG